MKLPFTLENDLERRIAADPAWQKGILWGKPRTGHLEGPVMYHIADILANIELQRSSCTERQSLRLIALIHDTFKYRVNYHLPRTGTNRHAHLARLFAARYISDPAILQIIELHDEAYYSWRLGATHGKWHLAEERVTTLLANLGSAFTLYVLFFYADSQTESKDPAPVIWFEQLLQHKGIPLPQV